MDKLKYSIIQLLQLLLATENIKRKMLKTMGALLCKLQNLTIQQHSKMHQSSFPRKLLSSTHVV
jgi:hypothetical protein